jgi:hypothetical protein
MLLRSGQWVYRVKEYGGGDDPGTTVSVFSTKEEAQAEANLLNRREAFFSYGVKTGSRKNFIGPDGYPATDKYFREEILGKSALREKNKEKPPSIISKVIDSGKCSYCDHWRCTCGASD